MNNDDKQMLEFYGEQLELIRGINRGLKRENALLIMLVISMALWIATS